MQLIIITTQPSSNQANQLYQSITQIKLLVFQQGIKAIKREVEEQRPNQNRLNAPKIWHRGED